MEDSFRVRVEKAFGSLASSSSTSTTTTPSSSLSSLWCLTDDEIERNQWNRDKDSPEPQPETEPDLYGYGTDIRSEMEKDLDDLEEEEASAKRKADGYDDEEWDIKKGIGLDCTLDYEEEVDEYDKVAVGKEKVGDRLYMSDINDYYGIDIDSNTVLPNSFMDVIRDPRANHMAAKIRLKEDAEAAKKMDSLCVTDEDDEINTTCEVDGNLKSILKRKDDDQLDSKSHNNQLGSKSQKRVRFDPECKDGDGDDEGSDGVTDLQTREDMVYHLPPDYPSGIPDYMRNPSKYTRYTFDMSSDVDDKSNRQAYMDFLKLLKRSNTTESQPDDAAVDLPKSLIFTSKKKTGDAIMTDNCTESKQNQDDAGKEFMLKRVLPVGIAASDAHDNETCAMEEDEPQIAADGTNSSQRPGRQYRIKAKLET